MSKLIDLLKKSATPEGPRIGFGLAPKKAASLPLTLIVKLPSIDKVLAQSLITDGANSLVVEVSSLSGNERAIRSLAELNPDVPVGLLIREPDPEDIARLPEGLVDFLVLKMENTPSVFLRAQDIAKVLVVDRAQNEFILRAINRLPIDAVLVPLEASTNGPLTIQQMLELQLTLELVRKFAIFIAPEGLQPDDLESVRDAGFLGVLLDLNKPGMRECLSLYRQKLENMPVRRRVAKEAITPVLPLRRDQHEPEIGEEEEEEMETL